MKIQVRLSTCVVMMFMAGGLLFVESKCPAYHADWETARGAAYGYRWGFPFAMYEVGYVGVLIDDGNATHTVTERCGGWKIAELIGNVLTGAILVAMAGFFWQRHASPAGRAARRESSAPAHSP